MPIATTKNPTKIKNMFCKLSDLTNEATVEQFFVNRLLSELGYADGEIKPKTSLKKLVISQGSKKSNYKPDYAIELNEQIRWILEAKAANESIDDHIEQCSGYCLALNRANAKANPTDHFVITNGVELRLYKWDDDHPIISLKFSEFVKTNPEYRRLISILHRDVVVKAQLEEKSQKQFELRVESISQINAHFAWCHQYIHKKDSLNQSAAFLEFVKLIFLKLLSDKKFHETKNGQPGKAIFAPNVPFSIAWIEKREEDHLNPLSDVQFKNLNDELEKGIRDRKRKRIFDTSDRIKLSAETIKGVVKRLQHIDLISIDADLNGRLFETFLNATMRGKDLGQFFTPRSVVKLAVALADPFAGRDRQDIIMDACCGSGGFLIEALAFMWGKIDRNASLSQAEKKSIKQSIANNSIFGDDISRDPPLARIARMNMFLHGDGGSRIFEVDILDKNITEFPDIDSPEILSSKEELRSLLADTKAGFADVILTNPPFAKEYHAKDPRDRGILEAYSLAYESDGVNKKLRATVRSSVLFLERYHDILRPGGRLIAIIDESILGSKKYREVRNWMRRNFLIKAVVSLPGDAFQRSLARVKTSLIYLVKKEVPDNSQGNIFMSWTTAVGVDDPARLRVLPADALLRKEAKLETARIVADFGSFLDGKLTQSTPYAKIVDGSQLADRLDVKHCAIETARQQSEWFDLGLRVGSLTDFADVLFPTEEEEESDE